MKNIFHFLLLFRDANYIYQHIYLKQPKQLIRIDLLCLMSYLFYIISIKRK
jgi:hypothetical protein